MNKKCDILSENGQALIIVISLLSIALLVVATAISVGFLDIFHYASYDASHQALFGAESGLQEGLLELRQDREYNGESFQVGVADITVEVAETAPNTYLIQSYARAKGSARRLELEVKDIEGELTIEQWREVY